jgi:shikimate kinase
VQLFFDEPTTAKPLVIALVGMPGSGKSTVGRYVARQLNLAFVDTDHEIESRIGHTIRDFFASHGEDAFRDIEAEVIATVSQRHALVVATGGGAVLREDNRVLLKQRCTVVYLRSTPDELARRLRHDVKRPLLLGSDPLRRLRDLFQVRDPLYQSTAHYTIDTGRPSVPTLVNMIVMQLELAGLVPTPGNPPAGV